MCDVTDAKAVQNLAEEIVSEFGRIDVLVTAAGIQCRQSVLDIQIQNWDRVINTNLNGTFYCAKLLGDIWFRQKKDE